MLVELYFQIPLIKDVPGVGENLQDHIAAYGLTWTTSAKGTAYNPFLYTANPMTYIRWKLWKTGKFSDTKYSRIVLFKTKSLMSAGFRIVILGIISQYRSISSTNWS